MSENWVHLIPDDPHFVPEHSRQEQARCRFGEIAPKATEISVFLSEQIRFQDCGANFEHIRCPSCHAGISIAWWQEHMDKDFERNGFKVATYVTPCCGTRTTMHDLVYEWPQGFCRFSLSAMNGDLGKLDESHKRDLEAILECKLRVIYQHV
jgi:hypothetical protein